MPTVTYSEEEYLVQLNKARTLEEQVQLLESYRPIWAMGLTSDSQAAQTWANATLSLWERLGANDKTQAMLKLDEALAKAQVLQPLTAEELDQIAMTDKGEGVFWYRGFLGKACERFAAKNGYTVKDQG